MFLMSVLQKQSKDRFGLEGDEESTMLEESVSPKKYVNRSPCKMVISRLDYHKDCLSRELNVQDM